MPGPHVDDKKRKKSHGIYGEERQKKRGPEQKEKKKNQISRACPKRLIAAFHDRIFNLFTLKSNILAQDQTSFLSCIL